MQRKNGTWLFAKSIIETKRYAVIPNGIDIEKFENSERTIHKPIEILFTGRLVYQKNPIFAVEVLAEFKKNSDSHITMIGKGEMDKVVRSEIKKFALTDSVTIVSKTNEIPKYYKAADLFLFPSHYEGLGITLIEAQASVVKCLSSDTVPRKTQCSLVDYKPLSVGATAWGEYIASLLLDNSLKINDKLLSHYDVRNTAKLMDTVYAL